ncbi:DEAD/DEAH box helicase [Bacillus sp. V3B]|uniref:DEAD/DEAH box helicase n=1 Tax=Bacillus sp. V3B TaxID=2804915 RepID=UPI00210C5413|nr:DEAD/DEAH box helicase [Bacillus sp. V3B]MCQ6274651.1 DEAD/DEAH box helicase [Bacillus sp. V3B]
MLKTRYIKIKVTDLDEDRYFLLAQDEEERVYPPSVWQYLLFNHHQESYFGTMVQTENIEGLEGIVLNGWQLSTLFAQSQFNRMIDWDWDETAQLCLASAHTVHDAIVEKEWMPDFTSWEQDEFRWILPDRVLDEFNPSFWEQEDVLTFMRKWFNRSLDGYMNQNQALKAKFGEKLKTLRDATIAPHQLAAFFDEESFREWIGIIESKVPFTLGLKLEEPAEADDVWELSIFLRDKKKPDLVVDREDEANFPRGWRPFIDGIEHEQQRWVRLFPWLAVSEEHKGLTNKLTEEEAWLFLTDASETLLALGVDILLPSWWQAMKSASLKVKAKVKGNSQNHRPSFVGLQAMLDYDWRFSMNGVDLSEDEFSQLVEEKRRLVYIRGRWVKLDPQFIQHIQALMKKAEEEGLQVRDILEQELFAAEETGNDDLENPKAFAKIQIELNRNWKQMVKGLRDLKQLPLETVPDTFQGELRPYQQLGMSWLLFLRRYGFGGCLADDMGLGKTVQLISYLLQVKEAEKPEGPALIICPTSVLGNWQKELERFAPDLAVHLHYGSNRLKGEKFTEKVATADVVLTSYGLTPLDLDEFESLIWSSIAIDEAQNIKNSGTKQSRAVRKLKGLHHIALTGTPMENRLTELWSIFDFTNHGYLGSLGQFQKRFVLPIERDDEKDRIHQLQALIRPFLLRRTKKDEDVALNLPDKLEQKEYCPLTAEQASLYEQLVQDTLADIDKLSSFERKGLILQMLSRLKQLCNHPALYLKEEQPSSLIERSAKLEKLQELVSSVIDQDESCLIFTQYIGMGQMIQTMIQEEFGLDVPFLNGSVPKQQRDGMITRFQNREFPIFLLSLKAGGTGLNLTAANHVIHYDRWWNPAVENQATDRAYRIGQKRFVHVHKLICTGTLEEKIDLMLDKKQALNDEVIQSDSWITELSTDELKDLVLLR